MKCWLRATGSLLALALALPAQAALQAWLDHDQVAPGDTVQLTLQRDGQGGGTPDLAPLRQDFDVLGQSQSSNVQIVNGSMSSQVQLQLTLSPKHDGKLSIPSLTWGGEHSPALTLTVANAPNANGKSGGSAPAAAPGVFLQSEVDTSQPFVQAAVRLKVRLYFAEPLYRASLDLPQNKDVLVQPLGKDQQSETTRNGRHYTVVERDYLLFPQRSGTLTLPGPVLDAQVVRQQNNSNDPFADVFPQMPFGGAANLRPLRLHGDAIKLDVRPRPANATGNAWLPARTLSLQGSWKPADLHAHVGDPLTLSLTLQAQGLTAAQLPDLAALLTLPDGLKAYPDQAKLDNTVQGDTVLGQRTQNIAVIADRPGRYTLPALHVQWWDVAANTPRDATLPAQTLEIAAAPGTAPAPQPAPPTSTTATVPDNASLAAATPLPASAPASARPDRTWQWISLTFALLWLATLATWLLSRRSRGGISQPPSARDANVDAAPARKAFLEACRAHDAKTARRALLDWARAHWPDAPPAGLTALAQRVDDRQATLLRELDRACYANSIWHGDALATALDRLPARHATTKPPADTLAPLYR